MKISISGIRGVYGSDLSAKDVFNFCSNFSNLIKSGKCVIGRDTRPTGKIILENVSAALMQNGIDVYNLGMVPTPIAFREAKKYGAECCENPDQHQLVFLSRDFLPPAVPFQTRPKKTL